MRVVVAMSKKNKHVKNSPVNQDSGGKSSVESADQDERRQEMQSDFVESKDIIADYNGYDYKKIFWEDGGREYEDAADRMAVRRLLPPAVEDLVDIAGGYGRLADEYLPRSLRFSTIRRASLIKRRRFITVAF